MSTRPHIYVGPFVRCAVAIQDETRERLACPNPACANRSVHPGDRFCPRCGGAYRMMSYTVRVSAIDDDAVQRLIDEQLVTPDSGDYRDWSLETGVHLWYANVDVPLRPGPSTSSGEASGQAGRDYHLDMGEAFFVVALMPQSLLDELSAFESHFAAELAILRDTYGADAVSLQWGILQDEW